LQIRAADKKGIHPTVVSWFYFKESVLQWYKDKRNVGTYYSIKAALDALEDYGRPLTELSQATPFYMDDFLSKWIAKGLKKETGLSHLRRAKTAIKWAEARSLTPTQNWTLIEMPAYAPRVEFFDLVEELDKIFSACKGHWKTAALLMAYAGLRSGEVRHLRWEDIDFKSRMIYIRAKHVIDADGNKVWWEPKESQPGKPRNREVDMMQRVEDHLRSLPNRTGFVCCERKGDLIRKNTYRRFFGRLTQKLKFKVYAHKFRHTYASIAISAGVSLPKLQVLMGHADIRSTQIYAHLFPKSRREAVDQMEASLPPMGPKFEVLAARASQ
jgi:integrase